MTPTTILHTLHEAPPVPGSAEHDGRCWICADPMQRGVPVEKWQGANFTGQNRVRLPTATHVCEACVWCMAGRPPDTLRMYSHLYEAGEPATYLRLNKGDKPAMREFLARRHGGLWFAAIADSGQKHVIPWAPLNGPGRAGSVLLDEQLVNVPDDQSLIDEMAELLTAGATKAEITSGDYAARAYQLASEQVITFERRNGGKRHSSWFTLAIWLAQRDEATVAARQAAEKEARAQRGKGRGRGAKGKAAVADGGGRTRVARGVSANATGKRSEALGPTRNAATKRGTNVRDTGGVVDRDATTPADRERGQGRLPGIG